MKKPFVAKLVLVGSTGVGKTSIVLRHSGSDFSTQVSSTIGASFCRTEMKVDDTDLLIQIWDTAGQERFRAMAPMYYRNADAALVVYDVTNRRSFESLRSWIDDLAELREVSTEQGKQLADSNGALFFETSALTCAGVEDMFKTTAKRMCDLIAGAADCRTESHVNLHLNSKSKFFGSALDQLTSVDFNAGLDLIFGQITKKSERHFVGFENAVLFIHCLQLVSDFLTVGVVDDGAQPAGVQGTGIEVQNLNVGRFQRQHVEHGHPGRPAQADHAERRSRAFCQRGAHVDDQLLLTLAKHAPKAGDFLVAHLDHRLVEHVQRARVVHHQAELELFVPEPVGELYGAQIIQILVTVRLGQIPGKQVDVKSTIPLVHPLTHHAQPTGVPGCEYEHRFGTKQRGHVLGQGAAEILTSAGDHADRLAVPKFASTHCSHKKRRQILFDKLTGPHNRKLQLTQLADKRLLPQLTALFDQSDRTHQCYNHAIYGPNFLLIKTRQRVLLVYNFFIKFPSTEEDEEEEDPIDSCFLDCSCDFWSVPFNLENYSSIFGTHFWKQNNP
ncbi:Ras family protein [Trichinella nativa]|uniref:Ras family protein n=1 Tax=Trichinella nativa TaxID=6335 RepID=A0A1Y3EXD0_9BILA|nr:Ras family protein [Trichinella nativa]